MSEQSTILRHTDGIKVHWNYLDKRGLQISGYGILFRMRNYAMRRNQCTPGEQPTDLIDLQHSDFAFHRSQHVHFRKPLEIELQERRRQRGRQPSGPSDSTSFAQLNITDNLDERAVKPLTVEIRVIRRYPSSTGMPGEDDRSTIDGEYAAVILAAAQLPSAIGSVTKRIPHRTERRKSPAALGSANWGDGRATWAEMRTLRTSRTMPRPSRTPVAGPTIVSHRLAQWGSC
ncbi:hypothetical protein F5890DRAFT_1472565 [Lentinula detonsa]|uniref:Uncharacterized protein n=1 Tax=Lentinula detonsa TaxID=2804962 RepID=A0AA38UW11_9AGAR|nr:hypothetical protein F5890DRAFT_1472565 [Lentinula detonsa]